MKRSIGDDNALLFLWQMPRHDFIPSDVEHHFWHGMNERSKWYEVRGISSTASGWGRRLHRLVEFGWLRKSFGSLYEWTDEGIAEYRRLCEQKGE